MQQGVVLFFVLNDTKRTKKVLQVLKDLRIEQYTKTFCIPMPSEEDALTLREKLADVSSAKGGTGNGILFTVPMILPQ